jgi:tight adherence protein C
VNPRRDAVVVAVAVAAWLLAGPLVAIASAVAMAVAVSALQRSAERRRIESLRRALPDAVDLFRLGADAGLTTPQAVVAVAGHGPVLVAQQLRVVVARTDRGMRLVDALEELRQHTPLTALADALVDAERYGTPLTDALARLAADARDQRRRDAEVRARRLPVQMLAPLVVCALPATVVLAVIPVVVVALGDLRW